MKNLLLLIIMSIGTYTFSQEAIIYHSSSFIIGQWNDSLDDFEYTSVIDTSQYLKCFEHQVIYINPSNEEKIFEWYDITHLDMGHKDEYTSTYMGTDSQEKMHMFIFKEENNEVSQILMYFAYNSVLENFGAVLLFLEVEREN